MLISSINTFPDVLSNNVLPLIWASLIPIKLTYNKPSQMRNKERMDMKNITEIDFSERQSQLRISGKGGMLLESKNGIKKDFKISFSSV